MYFDTITLCDSIMISFQPITTCLNIFNFLDFIVLKSLVIFLSLQLFILNYNSGFMPFLSQIWFKNSFL